MNAVIYCRVSTDKQAQEGISLESQQILCSNFAKTNGFNIDKIFIEAGASAKTFEGRKTFQEMYSYIQKNKKRVQAVIVYRLDRFSRDSLEGMTMLSELRSLGVEIKSATENIDDTPQGRFLKTIFLGVAQLDNDQKSERVTDCMKETMRKGKWPFPAPIGYKNDKHKSLVPNQDAKYIKRIFELYNTEKYKQSEIVEIIKTEGYVKITSQLVNKILKSIIYCGYLPCKQWFQEPQKGIHEPLVSEELFTHTQALLTGKKKTITSYNRNNPEFPLRGLLYCPDCGQKLTGSFAKGKLGKRYPYYHCRTKGCSYRPKTIAKEILENDFILYLESLKPKKQTLEAFKHILIDSFLAKQADRVKIANRLNNDLAELKETKKKLTLKYAENKIQDSEYNEAVNTLTSQIKDKEINLLQHKFDDLDIKECIKFSCCFLDNADLIWEHGDISVRQKMQSLIFPEKVYYNHGEFQTPKIAYIYKLFNIGLDNKSALVPRHGFEPR